MKSFSLVALFAVCGVWASLVPASETPEPLKGCAAKQLTLSSQIDQAREQGNSNQQAGLETALGHVIATCTDASLAKQRKTNIQKALQSVSQRQADLSRAMKQGDPDKIDKRQEKLEESRQNLQDAEDEQDK